MLKHTHTHTLTVGSILLIASCNIWMSFSSKHFCISCGHLYDITHKHGKRNNILALRFIFHGFDGTYIIALRFIFHGSDGTCLMERNLQKHISRPYTELPRIRAKQNFLKLNKGKSIKFQNCTLAIDHHSTLFKKQSQNDTFFLLECRRV